MSDIVFHHRPKDASSPDISGFSAAKAEEVIRFHRTLPGYRPTDLVSLPGFAAGAGVASVFIKDESSRFGLNSFKSLGGSWAVASMLGLRLGIPAAGLSFDALASAVAASCAGSIHFITATDGNHGRGVAWITGMLGLGCSVLMPEGSSEERVSAIRRLGADVTVTGVNYDATVETARRLARDNGWILTQDTDGPGYVEIPRLIMQGYLTMAHEAAGQLGGTRPTHIFVQAGVGSMAAAVTAYFANRYRDAPPVFTVVEAQAADCILRTALAGDGTLHSCTGSLRTMMAGLACGVPCRTAWEILGAHAENFAAISDEACARGMRMLARPVPGDTPVTSGESGASGFACLAVLLTRPECEGFRMAAGLGPGSRVLCISTEGDTDRENYRRVLAGESPCRQE